jgi:hypothetical protein
VLGEAEVVVGAEVQYVRMGGDVDVCALWRLDDALGLEEALGAQVCKLLAQVFGEPVRHRMTRPFPGADTRN